MNPVTEIDGRLRNDLLSRFLRALNERDGCPMAERIKVQAATMRVPKVVKRKRIGKVLRSWRRELNAEAIDKVRIYAARLLVRLICGKRAKVQRVVVGWHRKRKMPLFEGGKG